MIHLMKSTSRWYEKEEIMQSHQQLRWFRKCLHCSINQETREVLFVCLFWTILALTKLFSFYKKLKTYRETINNFTKSHFKLDSVWHWTLVPEQVIFCFCHIYLLWSLQSEVLDLYRFGTNVAVGWCSSVMSSCSVIEFKNCNSVEMKRFFSPVLSFLILKKKGICTYNTFFGILKPE